jgi:hypothetical protein
MTQIFHSLFDCLGQAEKPAKAEKKDDKSLSEAWGHR